MVTMQETAIFDHFAYFWGFLGSHGSMSAYTRLCNTPKWPTNQALSGSKEKNTKKSVTMVTKQETSNFGRFWPFFSFLGGPMHQWKHTYGHVKHKNDHIVIIQPFWVFLGGWFQFSWPSVYVPHLQNLLLGDQTSCLQHRPCAPSGVAP